MDAVTGIAELTLQARDPARLAAFYAAASGLEELSREPDRIWLAAGARARLGLWSAGAKEFGDDGGAHVHFAFTVEPGALPAIADRLREAAVEFEGPVEHEGGDRSVYARDPGGNVVEGWDLFERTGGSVAALRG